VWYWSTELKSKLHHTNYIERWQSTAGLSELSRVIVPTHVRYVKIDGGWDDEWLGRLWYNQLKGPSGQYTGYNLGPAEAEVPSWDFSCLFCHLKPFVARAPLTLSQFRTWLSQEINAIPVFHLINRTIPDIVTRTYNTNCCWFTQYSRIEMRNYSGTTW